MTTENQERLAEIAERLDNLTGSLQIPMPAQFHVDQLKNILPEIRDELRLLYISESGENPWED